MHNLTPAETVRRVTNVDRANQSFIFVYRTYVVAPMIELEIFPLFCIIESGRSV